MEVNPPTMSTPQALQHLYSLDASSPDLLRYLYYLIRTDEEEQYLTSLRGSELTSLVDFLDEVRSFLWPPTSTFRNRCVDPWRRPKNR